MACLLKLGTKGYWTLVDDEDFDPLSLHSWHICWSGKKPYVIRKWSVGGKNFHQLMHRQILEPAAGFQVDHINGRTLDNRRCNLRLCTRQENNRNRRKSDACSSAFKGVCLDRRRGVWVAHIFIDRRLKYLGSFRTEIDAAAAYDRAAIENYGEFALTNNIGESNVCS